MQGWTEADIAHELGVDQATISRDLARAFEAYRLTHGRKECEDLVHARLDMCVRGLAAKIGQGDTDAVRAALQLLDRTCRLMGLDAPPQLPRASADAEDDLGPDQLRQRLLEALGPQEVVVEVLPAPGEGD